MTLTFDKSAYCNLLTKVIPKIIETEDEYEYVMLVTEKLTFQKDRTPEETALYKLLVTLIETYESEKYALDEVRPHEALQHIMEASETRQSDLVGIIGSSGVVSEIVNGKRSISKSQAKALGEYFKVSSSLFI
ncbi:transcriptional regulator [Synechococcales cyanobacterium C]|uniref:Transcriptional regulator n=1 Tax=Petrachloros mirabilis ULC683 TaxID=2781853 RepID=A0A8K2A0N7_9CYAN|nr:transcriptional regulator [Petrachloros mirabilis]NCJ07588.1 transcriptional regulator [Petrachloros mirabilis ULC683]